MVEDEEEEADEDEDEERKTEERRGEEKGREETCTQTSLQKAASHGHREAKRAVAIRGKGFSPLSEHVCGFAKAGHHCTVEARFAVRQFACPSGGE